MDYVIIIDLIVRICLEWLLDALESDLRHFLLSDVNLLAI